MQDDRKNLDQYFAESLRGLRQKPPSRAWKRLEEDLLKERRHRRVVLYRWTAAAAIVMMALITGYFAMTLQQDHQLKENTLTQSETSSSVQDIEAPLPTENAPAPVVKEITQQETTVSAKKTDYLIPERKAQSLSTTPVTADDALQEIAVITQQENVGDIGVAESEQIEIAESIPQKQEPPQPVRQPETKIVPAEPFPDLFPKEEITPAASTTRWSIGGSFAPVYAYRTIRIDAEELPPDINPDKSYYDNSEEAMYSYAGGVDVIYRFQDQWQLQTGLYLSNMGHINQEVIAYEAEGVKDLLKFSSSTGVIDIKITALPASFVDNSIRRDSITDAVYINSSIHQTFTYVELPLLVRYSILDKRLGIHMTGGLSPGIMTNYRAQFTYEGKNIDLDNEGDFYTMIYNSQVGLGIHFDLTKALTLSLDPTFKYSLNSIRKDHSIEYHPYSISIFTGIRYSF
ncbi:MAG: outer membrane beta-barrel protein [Bacteroidales bacterium]|nr:outer membrane beta-barrel protein [Lentimicrobiaceae bacterium]MDD5693806.1 outer membrane beta-barrel protein [Bacteroidales bacterium]